MTNIVEPVIHRPRIQIGNLVMTYTQGPLVSGYAVDGGTVQSKESALEPTRWHGTKIPVELIHSLVSFFTWVNSTYRTEATARLYYNICTKQWACEVLHQKICVGLAAKELDDKPENSVLQNSLYSRGFTGNGSAHSHCEASAFQSGTDERDERQDAGFHITLGHLSKPIVDLHCRYTAYGLVYKVVNEDWFVGDIEKDYLTVAGMPGTFPEEWKARMQVVADVTPRWSPTPWVYNQHRSWRDHEDSYELWDDWGPTCLRSEKPSKGKKKAKSASVSGDKCEHNYLLGSFLPEDLILSVYNSVVEDMKATDDSEVDLMSRYLIQFLTVAVIAARAKSYAEEGDSANRITWRREFNKITSAIDIELDKFNPVYEFLAGFGVFGKLNSNIAISTTLEGMVWDSDLRLLIESGAITKATLSTVNQCDPDTVVLPKFLQWNPEGVLCLKEESEPPELS